jgi:hypothetical protein
VKTSAAGVRIFDAVGFVDLGPLGTEKTPGCLTDQDRIPPCLGRKGILFPTDGCRVAGVCGNKVGPDAVVGAGVAFGFSESLGFQDRRGAA